MQIDMPFFDSPEDALKAIIQQLGGIKKVGPLLFPDKSVDAAARYLLDCLNADRPEKLALTQVMMLLRLAVGRGRLRRQADHARRGGRSRHGRGRIVEQDSGRRPGHARTPAARCMKSRVRIVAVRHHATPDGLRVTKVVLDWPPVAVVSDVESIMGGWWSKSGGYPVGREFGTRIEPSA